MNFRIRTEAGAGHEGPTGHLRLQRPTETCTIQGCSGVGTVETLHVVGEVRGELHALGEEVVRTEGEAVVLAVSPPPGVSKLMYS